MLAGGRLADGIIIAQVERLVNRKLSELSCRQAAQTRLLGITAAIVLWEVIDFFGSFTAIRKAKARMIAAEAEAIEIESLARLRDMQKESCFIELPLSGNCDECDA